MAASSPYVTAAATVMMPLTTHDSRKSPGEPTSRAISAATMKMPDPIIEPMTIVVQSSRPSPSTRPAAGARWAELSATVAAMLPSLQRVNGPLSRGREYSAKRLEEFSRLRPDVLSSEKIMDHSYRIRSRFDNLRRRRKRYSTDRYERLARQCAHLTHTFQPHNRIGALLAPCRENRPERNIVG